MPSRKGGSQAAQAAATKEPTRQELCQQSRDLSGLVAQVNAVLPQFSPDLVCEALIQNDEDVQRTVEYLLTAVVETKASKKKKKKRQEEEDGDAPDDAARSSHAQQEDPAEEAAPEAEPEEPREERPPTAAEKTVLRLKKKLREIERIEEKLASGEKVDKMQLPKLERKAEVEAEIMKAMEVVQEEENQREQEQEQARLEAELERQRLRAEADARAAKEAAEAAERAAAEREARAAAEAEERRLAELRREAEEDDRRQRRLREQQPPRRSERQQPPPTQPAGLGQRAPPQGGKPTDAKGMELLSMLHTAGGTANYSQAEQLARDLSGKTHSRVQRFSGRSEAAYQPQLQLAPRSAGEDARTAAAKPRQFEDQGTWGEEAVDESAFMNEYSTPLDVSSMSPEQRRRAERIAKEIDGGGGGGGGGGDARDGGNRGGWRPGLWQGDGDARGGRWREDHYGGGGKGGSSGGYGGGRQGDRDGGHTGGKKGGGKGKGEGKGKGKRREKGDGADRGGGKSAPPDRAGPRRRAPAWAPAGWTGDAALRSPGP